jgi:hypothetical protein
VAIFLAHSVTLHLLYLTAHTYISFLNLESRTYTVQSRTAAALDPG